MKNKYTLLVIIAVFALLMVGAYVLYGRLGSQVELPQISTQDGAVETESTTADKKDPVPGFTVYDINNKPVSLSDFRGKPVVLNFWSSRCGPCQSEMPDFQKVFLELGDDVQFLMVNVTDGYWDTVQSASAFIQKNGYTCPVFYDTDRSAAVTYGISSLPTSLFFDSEGSLVAYAVGAIKLDTLMEGIEMILPESEEAA